MIEGIENLKQGFKILSVLLTYFRILFGPYQLSHLKKLYKSKSTNLIHEYRILMTVVSKSITLYKLNCIFPQNNNKQLKIH